MVITVSQVIGFVRWPDVDSLDMEELDGMILMAQRSQLQDRRDAATMLQGGDGDVDARISAAVHLMVGPEFCQWSQVLPMAPGFSTFLRPLRIPHSVARA